MRDPDGFAGSKIPDGFAGSKIPDGLRDEEPAAADDEESAVSGPANSFAQPAEWLNEPRFPPNVQALPQPIWRVRLSVGSPQVPRSETTTS